MKLKIKIKNILPFFEILITSLIVITGIAINRGVAHEHKLAKLQYPMGYSAIGVSINTKNSDSLDFKEIDDFLKIKAQGENNCVTQYMDYHEIMEYLSKNASVKHKKDLETKFKVIEYIGTNNKYFDFYKPKLRCGSYFTETENSKSVCVIGERLALQFFKTSEESIGQYIQLPEAYRGDIKIVGVIQAGENLPARTITMENGKSYRNISILSDYVIICPLGTLQPSVIHDRSNTIWYKGNKSLALQDADKFSKEIKNLEFTVDPEPSTFFDTSSSEKITLLGLNIFICLLFIVSGIGIMGVQLISVYRKREEIGLHMAVGARKRNILFIFLWDSLRGFIIPSLTGLFGGYFMIKHFAGTFNLPVLIDSVSVCIFAAVIFLLSIATSIYPAFKGANINPIDAMGRTPGFN